LVTENQSQVKPLYGIFTAVPPRYDLVNRVFTLGMDESWREKAARQCLADNPEKVLDICCGTGDLAVRLARTAKPAMHIYGLDYSQPMLTIAAAKAARYRLAAPLTFLHGDVSALPFPDGHFDAIGISFAFRNLTYKNPLTEKYLREIIRVMKPGGRFVIVESSQPPNGFIRAVSHFYLRVFVKNIGVWISGNRPAYTYLAESARRFYPAEELAGLLAGAGFSRVSFQRLFFGAAAIHIAIK